jgi:hypothetical protein
MLTRHISRAALGVVCAGALTACGGGLGSSSTATDRQGSRASTIQASKSDPALLPARVLDELAAAEHPRKAEFPPADGRSLLDLGKLVNVKGQLGNADGTFTPGVRRLAFGLTDEAGRNVYAPTAIYIAASATSPARGPFLAPADSMVVAPQYRSEQNSGPNGIQAIYSTELPVPRAGVFDVLALTRVRGRLIGSAGEIAAEQTTAIPGVGQRPPPISTDTLSTVHGNVALATTRIPPEQMHSVSFAQALGKRPIALLFSTPELCTSRVCGPVTDIMVELQHEFANRITFVHQEIYVANDPAKGLRPQMKAFHLETEPWLFTVNREGVIAARVEGAFGINEARQALEAALR